MKNFTKKFLCTLLMLTCVFALTACGQEETASSTQIAKQNNAELRAENVVRLVAALVMSPDDISSVIDEYENVELADVFSSMYAAYASDTDASKLSCEGKAVRNAFSTFESGLEDMGNILEMGEPTSTYDDDSITVEIPIKGENASGSVELIFTNDIYLEMTSCTLNLDETMGQLMARAGLNTLLGMGTVFVVLILISIIIYLFAFIPKLQDKLTKKPAPVQTVAKEPAEAPAAETQELSDDAQLVAVIAAAIAAYEGTDTSGFRVRSIRRSDAGKWKRA